VGAPIQTYARVAAVLLLVSFVAGGFGEAYVPSKLLVANDAVATTQNIKAFESLFRFGFAGYLVEAVCDISLALIFYVLLRAVNRDLALLAAFFGLVGTAVFAVAELFYFAPWLIVGGAQYVTTFPTDQLNTLVLLSLKLYGYGVDYPRLLNFSLRLPPQVSRHSYDDWWSWFRRQKLSAGSRASICIGWASFGACSRCTDIDCVAAC